MALHYKLNPLFESISGTISRRRFPDGRVESIIATKKGTIYKRTYYPPRHSSSSARSDSFESSTLPSRDHLPTTKREQSYESNDEICVGKSGGSE